jgi:hypothetical protein
MNNLNPELLRARLMRGALTGPAAEEISTMSRCKGKLDTGERCAIVAAPGKDLCTGCETRGAALYDKTVKVPAVLRAHDLKPGKIVCGREGCGYGVKKEGDFCKKHQEPVVIPVEKQQRGLDDGPKLPRQTPFYTVPDPIETVTSDNHTVDPIHFAADGVCLTACGIVSSSRTLLTTNWDVVVCENCLVWRPTAVELKPNNTVDPHEIACTNTGCEFHDETAEQNCGGDCGGEPAIASCKDLRAELDPDRLQVGSELPDAFTITGLVDVGRGLGDECMRATEVQISPAASTPPPPQEQVAPCAKLSSPLAALVVEPEPPLPDTAVVLDLGPMYETLVEQGVGTVTILELLDALFISKEFGLVRRAA